MKKVIFLLPMILLIAGSCLNKKGWEVTVSGKVLSAATGTITIKDWSDTTDQVVEVPFNTADKTFSKTLTLTEPGYYRIDFFGTQYVDFILFKDNININADGSSQDAYFQVTGSPDVELIDKVTKVKNNFQASDDVIQLGNAFSEAVTRNDQVAIAALQDAYQVALKQAADSIIQIMVSGSPSIAVISLLENNIVDRERFYPELRKIADSFTGDWKNYTIVKNFLASVELLGKTAVGAMAPEISLPDPDGNIVKLSSFRGRYVLVDFWAKWCGPCRRENPNLVRAYRKFKGDNFEIIGVSLDKKKEDWLQAIEEDQLDWIQVSDLKYFDSQAAKDYNISAIPFSVLINPDGIIIEKNLRGTALEKALSQYLTKS
jgi:peroxiredoxin